MSAVALLLLYYIATISSCNEHVKYFSPRMLLATKYFHVFRKHLDKGKEETH